jgi:hypothetical protein
MCHTPSVKKGDLEKEIRRCSSVDTCLVGSKPVCDARGCRVRRARSTWAVPTSHPQIMQLYWQLLPTWLGSLTCNVGQAHVGTTEVMRHPYASQNDATPYTPGDTYRYFSSLTSSYFLKALSLCLLRRSTVPQSVWASWGTVVPRAGL